MHDDRTPTADAGLSQDDELVLRNRLLELEGTLVDVSHQIHARPELRFEEHFASKLLAETLAEHGFLVETGVADLPTAFRAEHRVGEGGPTIAIFCEYDALEEIGHGCGHNLIAAAGLGAALLTKDWMSGRPDVSGRIVVVGSPGEEGGGGKAYLIEGGVLDGIDAAMMIHPSGENLSCMTTLARSGFEFTFTGRAAHAGVSPERGLNALDAAVLALTAIGLLRQQLPSDTRVHAVITDGGEAPNIIPETTRILGYVRSPDTRRLLDDIRPRVENCARGAALATGTEVAITETSPTYASLQPNPVLGRLVEQSFARLGRTTEPPRTEVFPGSTDMGNVSQVVPSIHPNVELVPGIGMHSRESTTHAGQPEGDRVALDGALLLAMTAVQLFDRPELLDDVRASFVEGVRAS